MPAIGLQFSAQNDFGSELIRRFSHGNYSHVDAVLDDGSLLGARNDVINGIPSGVQVRPKDYASFSAVKQINLETTPECRMWFYDFIHKEIDKPYDESAILGFAIDRDWREPDSFFCSELIALGLEAAKYFSFALIAPANKLTPSDLLLALSAVANI
jgi:hypothetical protein